MKKPNSKCKICGKEYYICALGIEKEPFKQIVCSDGCYAKWQKAIAARNKPAKKVKVIEEPTEE